MIIKNKKYGDIEVVKQDLKDDFMSIALKIVKSGDEIGYVSFKIKKFKAWLQKIEVKPEYQSQKFGHLLIALFEEYLMERRCREVEGKFYPANHHAKPFYEKHGYTIEKDGYDTIIYKFLSTKTQQV